jgi:hypothetical protein
MPEHQATEQRRAYWGNNVDNAACISGALEVIDVGLRGDLEEILVHGGLLGVEFCD